MSVKGFNKAWDDICGMDDKDIAEEIARLRARISELEEVVLSDGILLEVVVEENKELKKNQLKPGCVNARRAKCYSPSCDSCQADCNGVMRLVEVEAEE